MRLLGIDYGEKRVGLAVSDETGRFAYPREVLPAGENLISAIAALCEKESISLIVLGESRDLRGQPNPIMKKIEKFRTQLAEKVAVPIEYEPEFFSSSEAARLPGGGEKSWEKGKDLDARAAALILKSYIDRHHHD